MARTTDRTNATGDEGRSISLGRSIAFTLAMLAALLIVLEAAVRVRAWMRYGSTEIGMVDELLVLDPNSGLRFPKPGYARDSARVSIRINSLGFRGDDIAVEKPPRTIRIVTLGASTTFCTEVSNNQSTWPSRLQETLQRAHPDVKIEVVNAAVPGYVASESLKNLTARVLQLQPDVVTYYEANNDFAVDTRALAREQGLLDDFESPAAKLVSGYSLLFDLVHKNARILLSTRSGNERKLGSLPSDLPARYIGELDKIRRELTARDIPFVLSTFLVKYRRDQPRDVAIQNASISFYYMPWMTIEGLLDGMDMYNAAIVQFGRSHSVPVIEDSTSIPADDLHFADWAHFADAGAARMGDRFFRFLEDQGLVQRAIDRLQRSSALGPRPLAQASSVRMPPVIRK